MNKARHTLAALLFGLFIISQLIPAFVCSSICIHSSSRGERLSVSKQLSSFCFHKDEWVQIKKLKKDEIILAGKYFDIKSMVKTDDFIFISGIFDHHEDTLSLLSKDMGEKEQNLNKYEIFFQTLYCEEPVHYSFFNSSAEKEVFQIYKPSILTSYIACDFPPPKDTFC